MPKSNAEKTGAKAPVPGTDLAIALMAAGKGTRLKSKRTKVLHEIAGKPVLAHVIATARALTIPNHITVIIGHEAEAVRKAVESTGVQFVLQAEQRGTGHAILCAQKTLQAHERVLVLSGDAPLIRAETLQAFLEFHLRHKASMSILTARLTDPTGYGRIIRKSATKPEVTAIVEQKALNRKQVAIKEINSGIYILETAELFARLPKLRTDNAHHELYLTDIAALLTKDRKKVVAFETAHVEEVLGINTRSELAAMDAHLRARKSAELMAAGVTILRPETSMIDSDVIVGEDTIIEPFAQLLGSTQVGGDCRISSYCVIRDSKIGDGVTIRPGCILTEARVAANATIGPYSHLRPESDIGEGAHVGNFVETKKARIGKGSKANHLSYLGDAEIGERVNVGAGTITCNYDGVNKHATVIGNGAFIGSDSILVAPVKIGAGAYVAAASCITTDVPDDALGIGRATQVNKEGWAKKKREALAQANK